MAPIEVALEVAEAGWVSTKTGQDLLDRRL